MEIAIITERRATGGAVVLTNQIAPRRALVDQAERLDRELHQEVANLEESLTREGLLTGSGENDAASRPREVVHLWHAVGVELRKIVERHGFEGSRERRWLWEAISNLHASPQIKRAERGRNRNHFEYCYRLSRIPLATAQRIKWSEWVYFFDSTTIRGETRAAEWLQAVLDRGDTASREHFRKFSERLNVRIRKLDTSVLSRKELYALYDEAWSLTKEAPEAVPH